MDVHTLEVLLGFTDLQVDRAVLKKGHIELHCHSKFEENLCPSCLQEVQESEVCEPTSGSGYVFTRQRSLPALRKSSVSL